MPNKKEEKEYLISTLRKQYLDYGEDSHAECYVREHFKDNLPEAFTLLKEIFTDSVNETPVLLGVLYIISHYDHDEVGEEMMPIVHAALGHLSLEVVEGGVRVLESWGTQSCVDELKKLNYNDKWLMDYVNQVIKDLE